MNMFPDWYLMVPVIAGIIGILLWITLFVEMYRERRREKHNKSKEEEIILKPHTDDQYERLAKFVEDVADNKMGTERRGRVPPEIRLDAGALLMEITLERLEE